MGLKSILPDAIRGSYLRKFTLIVVAIMVVVGAVGFSAQAAVANEVEEQRQSELETLTTEEADQLEQYFDTQRDRVGLVSENDDFENIEDVDGVQESLVNQRERFGDNIYAVHYVDQRNGQITATTNDAEIGRQLAAPDIQWQNGLRFEDSNAVDESQVYRNDGNQLIAFASPVEQTDALIVLVVDVSRVGEEFSNTIEGGYTQAVNDEGVVEISADESEVLTEYHSGENATAVQQGLAGTAGAYRDGDSLIAYAPVESTNLVMIKHAPVDNAYAVASAVQRDVIFLIGTALLGFILVGAVIRRGTITALRDLRDTSNAIAAGDLDAEVSETERIDELGQVQQSFGEVKAYLNTVSGQANAIAEQEFDAPVLREDVPGDLGDTLGTMQADLEAFIGEVEQARDDARESRERAEELAATLRQQAEQFSETMERAADGDLTQRLDADIDNEAMQSIAAATNDMLTDLEQAVLEIQRFADQVNGTTEQVTVSAEEVKSASEEVSQSVQEIASGAEQQNENIQQASGEMSDLSATIEEVASSANEVAKKSGQAADIGSDGRERASEAIEVMNAIESQADATIEEVEALDDEMDQIGEIVDLIDDIAEQTNMLALNASIEAARAGEAGEGFGVVADEIKGLAEETSQATEEVGDLIGEVQASTGHAVTDIREMGQQVEDGIDTVDDAVKALEQIVEQVDEANTGIQSINDATDEQAASTEEAVSMVDEVGSISEETASQAESAAAAAEEQTASINEVTDNIESLSGQATDLRDLLDQFDVRAGSSPSHTASGTSDTVASTDD